MEKLCCTHCKSEVVKEIDNPTIEHDGSALSWYHLCLSCGLVFVAWYELEELKGKN